jgi:hypothetical protein
VPDQPDEHLAFPDFRLVDAACGGVARAEVLHGDRREAIEAQDRGDHRLVVAGEVLAGRAEKNPENHGARQSV